MAEQVRVLMARPITITSTDTVTAAAVAMREADVGLVVLENDARLVGVLTDRDIVVRCVAAGLAPHDTPAAQICSRDVITINPNEEAPAAAAVMREHSVRRLPVVDGDELVGVISLGDLAVQLDSESALAQISAARRNV
jgi:CBS domain-containing protein